jgi:rubrerythrin
MTLRARELAVPAPTRASHRRIEIRCLGCGYGAVVARLPGRCPMCGVASWTVHVHRHRPPGVRF